MFLAHRRTSDRLFFALNVLLVGACPVVIAQRCSERRIVDIHTVLGAICIYVLIGMIFAFFYGAIGLFEGTFFVQTKHATPAQFPLLQLRHRDDRRLRRLHGRGEPRSGDRRVRSAGRSAVPRHGGGSGGQQHGEGAPIATAKRRRPRTKRLDEGGPTLGRRPLGTGGV